MSLKRVNVVKVCSFEKNAHSASAVEIMALKKNLGKIAGLK